MRLRSGIFYALNRLAEDGHCFAKRDELINKSKELLGVEDDLVSITLDHIIHEGELITEELPQEDSINNNSYNKAIYLPPFYYSEVGTAKRLINIANSKKI